MNYNILFIIFSIFLITGCQQNDLQNKINLDQQFKYRNLGFALVYSDELKEQKKISKKLKIDLCLFFIKI